ncbi:MAG: tRNA threonylcarbamoyladenosine biosynthesis protein TsaB [Phycisphaerales bacterium]
MPSPAARALTLAIETSNPGGVGGGGVAIGEGGPGAAARVLGVEAVAPTSRASGRDDGLMPAIDRLARRLGIGPRDLTRIACSVGPGGYTGVRIAVAAAKLIAEAVGARCVGVPSARVAARRVDRALIDVGAAGGPARPFAVAVASKGDATFLTVFDAPSRPRDAGRLVTADDFASADFGLLLADRFLPDAIRAAAARRGIEIVEPVFDAAACFEESLILPEIDPEALLPVYPREPDAVTQWRRRSARK